MFSPQASLSGSRPYRRYEVFKHQGFYLVTSVIRDEMDTNEIPGKPEARAVCVIVTRSIPLESYFDFGDGLSYLPVELTQFDKRFPFQARDKCLLLSYAPNLNGLSKAERAEKHGASYLSLMNLLETTSSGVFSPGFASEGSNKPDWLVCVSHNHLIGPLAQRLEESQVPYNVVDIYGDYPLARKEIINVATSSDTQLTARLAEGFQMQVLAIPIKSTEV
ncbi:hypothetical protein H6762_02270 [Candidatus Nomurabacteria bacterium]|nr:hypothetical protein [Candidatus Nomurabacteria bacterium]